MISVNADSLHAILINIHALAAAVSLITGTVVISRRNYLASHRLFAGYLWSLIGMVVFLGGAMLMRWSAYTSMEQIAFSGLFVLALYMIYRAFRAQTLLQSRQKDWKLEYIHHIGFTLIALFEGFIVVALINLRAAGWVIAVVAMFAVLAGRRTIDIVETNQHVPEPVAHRGKSP